MGKIFVSRGRREYRTADTRSFWLSKLNSGKRKATVNDQRDASLEKGLLLLYNSRNTRNHQ